MRRGAKRKTPLHVSIGQPRRDTVNWFCPFRLKGLVNEEKRIFGVDSWQATILALRCVEIILQGEVRKGGQLYYFGEKITVQRLFANGKLGAP